MPQDSEDEDEYVSARPPAEGPAVASMRRSLLAVQSIAAAGGAAAGSKAQRCDAFIEQAMAEIAGINIYDIYADVCTRGAAPARQLAHMLAGHPAGASSRPLLGGGRSSSTGLMAQAPLTRKSSVTNCRSANRVPPTLCTAIVPQESTTPASTTRWRSTSTGQRCSAPSTPMSPAASRGPG